MVEPKIIIDHSRIAIQALCIDLYREALAEARDCCGCGAGSDKEHLADFFLGYSDDLERAERDYERLSAERRARGASSLPSRPRARGEGSGRVRPNESGERKEK